VRRDELNGFPGQMTRLREVYQAMRETFPLGDATDALIEVYETGDRIGYHPETAAAEISHFHEALVKAQTSVREKDANFDAHSEEAIKRHDRNAPSIAELTKRRTAAMRRAAKLMEDTAK
jgi:hypothetical protein